MATVTDFWDRCVDIGDANGTHIWKCPKRHPDAAREIKTLFPGAEAIEDLDCYWIVCRSRFAEALDRIADEVLTDT